MSGEGMETVKSLTAKEIKKLAKPEFAANPEKFYPTKTFEKFGFHRAQCPKCGENFWRHTDKKEVCGDSQCVGKYTFIGKGCGKYAKNGEKLKYADAWKTFEKSMVNARIPHTSIKRYPVVARWRADVDYVAAGIFCFQPYCVTGELEPPANPLVCPQFCLRFNDLDSIGLTGRHYAGFVMMGMQVFNTPEKFVYFKEEVVEFNLNWLINELEIDPDEITLIEDVWAGGGNLGPSVEYFIGGLELGNMVFMQYKTYPDGSRQPLQVQVIDVGVGLERVPWLINGSPTSYVDTFPSALARLQEAAQVPMSNEVWEKFGPYSCLLNVDEVDDMEETWQQIADEIGMPKDELKAGIEKVRDMYIVCDHTRALVIAIEDGSLPSNVGGASNLRGILRRVFAILKRNGWWENLGLEGLIDIFNAHKKDLGELYGEFPKYDSLTEIITLEYERWQTNDTESKAKLDKVIKKKKGVLTLDDWVLAVTAWGIDPDRIHELTGLEIPGGLYYEIATREEMSAKQALKQLYDTAHMQPTVELFYKDDGIRSFDNKIVEIVANVQASGANNIVVLEETAFYPTSGGQEHDTGVMTIEGSEYKVVDVNKVGRVIFHILDRELPGDADSYKGKTVSATIDADRRTQLRNHHTATHIMSAACREVLGPHVWQNGAKKTIEQASLDITHYRSLTHEEEGAIELAANRIANKCIGIDKYYMRKEEAEKKWGFNLYQGGIVPGNELRIVDIHGTDTEACCGTHCDNTGEVGCIRLIRSTRISDGIVRLYFVAGERSIEQNRTQSDTIHELTTNFSVTTDQLVKEASKFFDNHKKFKKIAPTLVSMQLKAFSLDPEAKLGFVRSDIPEPGIMSACGPSWAESFQKQGKALFFIGPSHIYGLMGSPDLLDVSTIEATIRKAEEKKRAKAGDSTPIDTSKKVINVRNKLQFQRKVGKKKERVVVENVAEVTSSTTFGDSVISALKDAGFVEFS
eukprot:TRINITY_DN2499_c0_g1_i1.p1 TRINITY_DN2499_c0_g1~~TRINITY_DN2499_c0_g1_i1.p1  ORF type:complete len:973 (-),score=368.24 TRINITY_DN2499_c0_g1_i1:251-3169(-)